MIPSSAAGCNNSRDTSSPPGGVSVSRRSLVGVTHPAKKQNGGPLTEDPRSGLAISVVFSNAVGFIPERDGRITPSIPLVARLQLRVNRFVEFGFMVRQRPPL